MSSDKTRRQEITETGALPSIELEPLLHREAPSPPLPEIIDKTKGAETSELPSIPDTLEDSETHDDDSPKGKKA